MFYPFARVNFKLFMTLSHVLPFNWMKLKMKFMRIEGNYKFTNILMK